MSKSLTEGSYFLNIAIQYFKNFAVECKSKYNHNIQKGISPKADAWLNKLNFVENDVFCSITEKSRERFRSEIKNGDNLYFQDILVKLAALSIENRELIEKIVDRIIVEQKSSDSDFTKETKKILTMVD